MHPEVGASRAHTYGQPGMARPVFRVPAAQHGWMEDVDEYGRGEDVGLDIHGGIDGCRRGWMRAGVILPVWAWSWHPSSRLGG